MTAPAFPCRSWLPCAALAGALLAACGGGGAPTGPGGGGGGGGGGATPDPLFDLATSGLPTLGGTRNMDAASVDVDRDGDLDIVVAREFLTNVLYLNLGGGVFSNASDARLPRTGFDSEDVAVGDFDGDGDPDLAFAAEDDARLELWLNDGTGRFADASSRLPASGVSNAVVAVDVDRDGDLDLVFGRRGQNFLFLNDGAGNFTDATASHLPPDGATTHDVEAGDVDGDGDPDLVVGNIGRPRLLLNDGTGRFADATDGRLPATAGNEYTREAELVDLDGDGDLDLYLANVSFGGANPQDRILLNDGAGRFTDVTATHRGGDGASTLDAEFVDLDGDGDRDVVLVRFDAGSAPLLALRNDGAGRLTPWAGVFPGGLSGNGLDIEAADLNGDGRIDLFVSFHDAPNVLLLRRP